jgi:periplasmic divalent cation tolerance protein
MQDLFIEKPGYIQVNTAVDSQEQAEKIAERLLNDRLAACVQMIPGVQSWYLWKGEKKSSSEIILQIKTKMDLYGKLTAILKEIHPYELPEIAVVPLVEGSTAYFKWIDESTDGGK